MAALIAFAALWVTTCALLTGRANLRKRRRIDTGPLLRNSPWGTGEVNGLGFLEAVRVTEFGNGWLVHAHWVFGGGQLWLPRDQTRASARLKRSVCSVGGPAS